MLAREGHIFVRKADGFKVGRILHLGYTHYINRQKLEEPKKETIEDYEEVEVEENE